MIKPEEQIYTTKMNTLVPDHWRIRYEEVKIKHPHTKRIIPIGEGDDRFRSMLIIAIKEAKKTIMLSSFILSDNVIIEEILNATKRQVRCYLLFSTEVQLSKDYKADRTDFDQKVLDTHKSMLDRLVGKALARTNDHLHAKFLLIDYNTPDQKGFVSTANFTKEALTRNQELGVVLTDNEIKEAFDFFRRGFWVESNQELIRKRSWDDVKIKLMNSLPKYSTITTTMKDIYDLRSKVNQIINEAKGPIIISSYGFAEEYQVIQTILNKAQKNEIIILSRCREKNHPTFNLLVKEGVKIFAFDYLHSKFILAPQDQLGIIMTANIEPRGLDSGYEIGVILNKEDIRELGDIASEWIKAAPYIYKRQTDVQKLSLGKILLIKGTKRLNKEIFLTYLIKEFEERPNDLRNMYELLRNKPKYTTEFSRGYSKTIECKRVIIPPTLPQGAVKVKAEDYWRKIKGKKADKDENFPKKFPIPVFAWKREYFGVIKSWKEFESIKDNKELPSKIRFVTG